MLFPWKEITLILAAVASMIFVVRERNTSRNIDVYKGRKEHLAQRRRELDRDALHAIGAFERIARLQMRYRVSIGGPFERPLRTDLFFSLVGLGSIGLKSSSGEFEGPYSTDMDNNSFEALFAASEIKLEELSKLISKRVDLTKEVSLEVISVSKDISRIERISRMNFVAIQSMTVLVVVIGSIINL